uniref:DUF4138 domain-containing protein n=1 Tax=Roseihalotalea indica TaxID=2867963 RepID=A0AA49GKV5_9BACT|nr:hypothetical protein K4G66_18780 [Tunicatimonas sp. TK19036]
MKYVLSLVFIFQALIMLAQDTIYVSDQAKSYLLFDAPVTLADVGNPSLYHTQIENNSIFLVATKDSVADTPFYAVVNGEPFTARLCFDTSPPAFYDFRKRNDSGRQKSVFKDRMLSNLQVLASQPDLNYVSSQKNRIRFQLVGLMHDLEATYLKFNVENTTSLHYATDFVGFEQRKRYKKGFWRKKQEAHFPVEPLTQGQVHPISPYSESYLYYVLPLQALGQKEAVTATLREKSGNRSVSIKIPARLLRRADLF